MTTALQTAAIDADWATEEDLSRLGRALRLSGFGEYAGCFGTMAPRRDAWARHRDRAPERLRPLIDLLLLGCAVPSDALPRPVRDWLANAGPVEFLGRTEREVTMLWGLVIVPVFGRWLLCHAPVAGQHFYFGDDTLALLARMMPKPGGRCLDVCAGPGMLALHAAGIAGQVVAVERLPAAARLACLNSHLNALSHRIEVREGDLYQPIAGERFDTVIANPPMLPIPAAIGEPLLGHAGEDGLAVATRLLAGLPDVLRADGTAQIIGTTLSDGAEFLALESLREAASDRLDLIVSIMSHRVLAEDSLRLDAIVAALRAAGGTDGHDVEAEYLATLTRHGATAFCHFFVHACHGTGRIDRIDVSAANRAGDWGWRP